MHWHTHRETSDTSNFWCHVINIEQTIPKDAGKAFWAVMSAGTVIRHLWFCACPAPPAAPSCGLVLTKWHPWLPNENASSTAEWSVFVRCILVPSLHHFREDQEGPDYFLGNVGNIVSILSWSVIYDDSPKYVVVINSKGHQHFLHQGQVWLWK